jgi:hypothetical protein
MMEAAPAAKLITRLLAARRRGIAFADAWPDALLDALTSLDQEEHDEWHEAFWATMPAWHAAYDGAHGPGMPLAHVDLDDAEMVVSRATLVA